MNLRVYLLCERRYLVGRTGSGLYSNRLYCSELYAASWRYNGKRHIRNLKVHYNKDASIYCRERLWYYQVGTPVKKAVLSTCFNLCGCLGLLCASP